MEDGSGRLTDEAAAAPSKRRRSRKRDKATTNNDDDQTEYVGGRRDTETMAATLDATVMTPKSTSKENG